MKYLFFINPAAGKGIKQKRLLTEIEEYFKEKNLEYKIIVTRFSGDAEQIARKAALSGEELRIYACGGEGTCYEIINGIAGYDNVAFGIIPCGSANDFLKFFGNTEPFSDIDAQVNGIAQYIDLIKAGDRYCFNGCSVGMDAMVAQDMKIFKRIPLIKGSLAYKLAIAKNFLKVKIGVKLNVTVDDEYLGEQNCLFAVVANAPYYGGGYMGAPDAVPNDGELDFTIVNTISHLRVLKFLPFYEKGEFSHFDFCRLRRCKSMSFTSKTMVPVNLDGEITECDSLDFSIVHNGVKLILPSPITLPKVQKEEVCV